MRLIPEDQTRLLDRTTVEHFPDLCLQSILDLVTEQARRCPEAGALDAPGRRPMNFGGLLNQIQRTGAVLNELGIGRSDRVAIVLPNGPEMASAFLSVAASAIAAPLNPEYRAHEFDFYLSDLQASALIIARGSDSPATAVAVSRKIPVIELVKLPEEFSGELPGELPGAGAFELSPCGAAPARQSDPIVGFGRGDDVALVLHTSGTTARPKIVPLSHSNLCVSARNIARVLELSPNDRCLNIMPLFHIHGLVAALMASLATGGRVICTPGFIATKFFDWLDEHRPTWYTAVPTMHQAIVARSGSNETVIRDCPLRFVRSSSSALPPRLAESLESTFGVPAIEAYGMTEAAHQMCSNPVDLHRRKHGSVGVPSGPEMAIMDHQGAFLPAGEVGEVVIRGSNVIAAYQNNEAANAQSFVRGWFRTGDEGRFDEDGYLFLTGRLKEIINRGGEKISPREVDEVLLEHDAVCQAVTFAMPDPRLGEEIAAAVVLREGTETNERELREFTSNRLADFKVPRRVLILDQIPKGPTGKLQRIGMAAKLGLEVALDEPAERSPQVEPKNELETTLAGIWCEVLKLESIGVKDNFFELGGDSVLATQILSRVKVRLGIQMQMLVFFDAPTIAGMASALDAGN